MPEAAESVDNTGNLPDLLDVSNPATEEGTPSDVRQDNRFGGLSASEAGRRSGVARAANKAKGDERQQVREALARKAKTGDAAAARELRAWIELEERTPIEATRIEDMSPEERRNLAARIRARLDGGADGIEPGELVPAEGQTLSGLAT